MAACSKTTTVRFRKLAQGLIFCKGVFEGIIFGGVYIWRGLL